MSIETVSNPAPALPEGATIIGDKPFMRDARGAWVPLDLVKPVDMLMDDTVRKMFGHAEPLNAQIARFKAHCFDDFGAFQALIAEKYGAKVGGEKGNTTLTTIDGTLKVTIQVADRIEFGPELQAAKTLIDECLTEWSEGSRDELRAIVNRAFQVDKEGQINRAELFMLMRTDIRDERWLRAMEAIRDSIRIIGSKTYIRFHRRDSAKGKWQPVTIDIAAVD
ncbi:DUF3164 family protein [Labrys neptuniae]|uniref:DUF3164 family protein n=1 Tax=Labrys neptuniae TaxID=376174 RepID=A0ABV3PGI2_9HYPH